jgi:hypothetical protein
MKTEHRVNHLPSKLNIRSIIHHQMFHITKLLNRPQKWVDSLQWPR